MYPLNEVLIIMLLAVICGSTSYLKVDMFVKLTVCLHSAETARATSYLKVDMFVKSKKEWLETFLKLENGIPDACTFHNVIKEINIEKLHMLFCKWMKSVVKNYMELLR